MMTLVETEPIGRVQRERDPADKRDRKAAIRYGRARHNPYRREPKPGQWVPTLMETWALDHNRFIGDSIRDDEADLRLLPHQRPGLVRLGALAWGPIPGGILIERLRDLGDLLTQAVVGKLWLEVAEPTGTELWYGERWQDANRPKARQVTAQDVTRWVTQASPTRVEDELDKFKQAIRQHILATMKERGDAIVDFWYYLGSGPLRDTELARQEYRRLASNNTDEGVLRYLNAYGYTNLTGTVGRWYHANLQSLRESHDT